MEARKGMRLRKCSAVRWTEQTLSDIRMSHAALRVSLVRSS